MNRKLTCGKPELHCVPVHSPWFHVGIDFVGPVSPPSLSGNSYILTLSDYFTKWVEAVPLPTKAAHGVATVLLKVHMGIILLLFFVVTIIISVDIHADGSPEIADH